jgi:serine/threonine protein kinase
MVSDLTWEESHLRPGSRIGKYVLEQQIGHGGMAVVFRARDDQLGRLVALKIMASSLASDTEFRERFVRESKAAAAVDDPHIIPVFEAGESAGVLFMATRYVAGGDVRSLLVPTVRSALTGPPRSWYQWRRHSTLHTPLGSCTATSSQRTY